MSRLLSRFNLKIEPLKPTMRRCWANTLVTPLYNLDFISPQSFDDFNDAFSCPTGSARALG